MSQTDAPSSQPDDDALDFESAMSALQDVVAQMEAPDAPLDAMLNHYERGMQLVAVCQKSLDEAELRIEQITQGKDGELKATPIDAPAD